MELLPVLNEPSYLAQYLICLKIVFQRHAHQIHLAVVANSYLKLLKYKQYHSSRIHNLCEVHPIVGDVLLMELLPVLGEPSYLAQYLICLKTLFQRHAYQIHLAVVTKSYLKLLKYKQYHSSRIHNLYEVHPIVGDVLLAEATLVNHIVQDRESHFALHFHHLHSTKQSNVAENEIADNFFGWVGGLTERCRFAVNLLAHTSRKNGLSKLTVQIWKKLWCCVSGGDQNKSLVLSNELINIEWAFPLMKG